MCATRLCCHCRLWHNESIEDCGLTPVLHAMSGLQALRLSSLECQALEIALSEESERRALEGELALLEAAWRDAEAIASAADSIWSVA